MAVDLGDFGDPGAPPPPGRAPRPRPRVRRPRGRSLLVLAVAFVVVAADVALAVDRHAAAGDDAGPVAAAQQFYDAVRDRDAPTALGLLDLPKGTDRRLLTAAALAQPMGLTQAGATLVDHHGDEARVEIAYAVLEPAGDFGQPQFAAVELTLRRADTGLLHDHPTWRVVGGLPTVTVLTANGVRAVDVAGARVGLDATGSATLPSFPGLVPVATVATPLLGTTSLDLIGGGVVDPTSETLAPQPSTAVDDAATAAVGTAFAARTDRLPGYTSESRDQEGYVISGDGVVLDGTIREQDGRGHERVWTTAVTVRLTGGSLVAGDVRIAVAPPGS